MAEWIECKISDIGTVVGGATPSTKKPENYENGTIAWITPKDLSTFTGRYIQRGERNITEIGLKSCSTQLLSKDTVLFSSRAPIGYVAIAANELCTNQGFKSVVPNENTDPLFLYYLLKYNKDKIEGMGSGTTFKEVSGNTMKNIVVSVPTDKKVQERISSMLGSIDDKIEENERINNNFSYCKYYRCRHIKTTCNRNPINRIYLLLKIRAKSSYKISSQHTSEHNNTECNIYFFIAFFRFLFFTHYFFLLSFLQPFYLTHHIFHFHQEYIQICPPLLHHTALLF